MLAPAIEIQEFESSLPSWPKHWHEEVQVIASLSGISRHSLKNSTQPVNPTDVLLVNPGDIHTTVAEGGSCWRFLSAHLPIASFGNFREQNANSRARPLSFSPSVLHRHRIYPMLASLYEAGEHDSPLYRDHCLQELIHTLWSLSREPLCLPRSLTISHRSLSAARDYLHENFAARIKISQLSDLAGLSEFHFCRQFTRQFGVSPHAYQLQLRLVAAKRMLRGGSSIENVSQQVGFSSQSHLTRTFLRATGLTPARFQKNSRIVPKAGLC